MLANRTCSKTLVFTRFRCRRSTAVAWSKATLEDRRSWTHWYLRYFVAVDPKAHHGWALEKRRKPCKYRRFLPGRCTKPCKYHSFVQFWSLQKPQNPFPTKSFLVFGIFFGHFSNRDASKTIGFCGVFCRTATKNAVNSMIFGHCWGLEELKTLIFTVFSNRWPRGAPGWSCPPPPASKRRCRGPFLREIGCSSGLIHFC